MKGFFQIVGVCTLLALGGHAGAESAATGMRKEIKSIPPVAVRNPSTDVDGDIVAPAAAAGYTGAYGNRMALTDEKRRLTRNLDRIVAFDPNAGVLYPGSLVQGKSLPDGVLEPIVAARASMRIIAPAATSADLEHGSFAGKRVPKGNDDWDYALTVELTFADGSQLKEQCQGRNSCGKVW